jgi:hypothetical protein
MYTIEGTNLANEYQEKIDDNNDDDDDDEIYTN